MAALLEHTTAIVKRASKPNPKDYGRISLAMIQERLDRAEAEGDWETVAAIEKQFPAWLPSLRAVQPKEERMSAFELSLRWSTWGVFALVVVAFLFAVMAAMAWGGLELVWWVAF